MTPRKWQLLVLLNAIEGVAEIADEDRRFRDILTSLVEWRCSEAARRDVPSGPPDVCGKWKVGDVVDSPNERTWQKYQIAAFVKDLEVVAGSGIQRMSYALLLEHVGQGMPPAGGSSGRLRCIPDMDLDWRKVE